MVTDGQTNRQTKYCNPRCACAPRVNESTEVQTLSAVLHASFTRSHACQVLSILLLSMRTVCSLVSDDLLMAFCNLILAFITDVILSDCNTRMHFMAFSGKVCSAFLLARKICSQDLHTFSLSDTIVLHCGHTLLRCRMQIATHRIGERLLTKRETKWPLSTTWSNIMCKRIFRSDKNG